MPKTRSTRKVNENVNEYVNDDANNNVEDSQISQTVKKFKKFQDDQKIKNEEIFQKINDLIQINEKLQQQLNEQKEQLNQQQEQLNQQQQINQQKEQLNQQQINQQTEKVNKQLNQQNEQLNLQQNENLNQLQLSSERLAFLKKKSPRAFLKSVFTAIVPIEAVYRHNKTGNKKNQSKSFLRFDVKYYGLLKKCLKVYKDSTLDEIEFSQELTTKFVNLNDFFNVLINNYSKNPNSSKFYKEKDLSYFNLFQIEIEENGYDEYVKNPAKFFELDSAIDNELEETDSN